MHRRFKRHRPGTAHDLTRILALTRIVALCRPAYPGPKQLRRSNRTVPTGNNSDVRKSPVADPNVRTREIDRSSLAIVFAKDCSALLIFGTQVIVNVQDGRNHFLPAKLIGENVWERSRVRCLVHQPG